MRADTDLSVRPYAGFHDWLVHQSVTRRVRAAYPGDPMDLSPLDCVRAEFGFLDEVPIAGLIRDVRRDPAWPIHATTLEELRAYLHSRSAGETALDALDAAYLEFCEYAGIPRKADDLPPDPLRFTAEDERWLQQVSPSPNGEHPPTASPALMAARAEGIADANRLRGKLLSPEIMVELAERSGLDLGDPVLEQAAIRRTEEQARDLLAAVELARLRGDQGRLTAREFVDLPQAPAVIESVLAAEVNLLGGPPGAGKSLLARDWSLSVATGTPWRYHEPSQMDGRYVLWIASEGLHDFHARWRSHPLWEKAADAIFVEDQPVNLVTGGDVDWLLDRYQDVRPGLVVFDVIYGMGMADDTGTRDVLPVLLAMKRISAEWGAATLALGHPGLAETAQRRLRGSSNWRALAYCEWQMGEGYLTCEKSKLARAETLRARYAVEYPEIRWLSAGEALRDEAGRWSAVREDIERYPDASDRDRARRLGPALGLSEKTIRRLVKAVRDGTTQDAAGS